MEHRSSVSDGLPHHTYGYDGYRDKHSPCHAEMTESRGEDQGQRNVDYRAPGDRAENCLILASRQKPKLPA